MRYRIGTSGWSYSHWISIFYPENLDRRKWLSFYASHFYTVEVNSTFYRLPFENMVKGWVNKTPDDFSFSVKGWRLITHKKKLRNVDEDVEIFMKRMSIFGSKLEVILWQLPPSLKKDVVLLREFLSLLPRNVKHAVEFRHSSWFDDDIYQLLEEYGIALCIADSMKFRSPWVKTTSFVYARFHGPEKLYASGYSREQLEEFARNLKRLDSDSFVYFNNDFGGYALENARTLKEILSEML